MATSDFRIARSGISRIIQWRILHVTTLSNEPGLALRRANRTIAPVLAEHSRSYSRSAICGSALWPRNRPSETASSNGDTEIPGSRFQVPGSEFGCFRFQVPGSKFGWVRVLRSGSGSGSGSSFRFLVQVPGCYAFGVRMGSEFNVRSSLF